MKFYERNQKYFVVFGGFLLHFSMGVLYSSGNLLPQMITYMQNKTVYGNEINERNSVWVIGLIIFGVGASMSSGGFLEKIIGPSMTVLIGGWIMSINVCITYFTIQWHFAALAISYGLIAGLGSGIAYGVAMGTPCRWFPERKGLIIGVIVAGYGVSASFFDFIQMQILGKDKSLSYLPQSFLILGLIYGTLQFIGSIILKNPPDETKKLSNVESIQNPMQHLFDSVTSPFSEQIEIETHHLFLEFDFWILWLTFFFNASCVVIFTSVFNKFGVYLLSDHKISIPIVGSLFNFAGRIFWGNLIDTKSYKLVMLVLTIVVSIFMGTLNLLHYIQNVTGRHVLYFVWVSIINFFQSGNFSIFPMMCGKLFGLKNLVSNYGILFTSCSVSGILVSAVMSNVTQNEETFYFYVFISCSVLSVFAAILTLLFRGKSLILHRY